jgi:hypothetical protein
MQGAEALVNTRLRVITGLSSPIGVAVSGNDLFVANAGGTIGEYTTSGSTVNASLITGLSQPFGLAISGNDLYVVNYNNGAISEYMTSGLTINSSLITGLSDPRGLAISGNDLFVANWGNNTIGEYTTSGSAVNASLITGLDKPYGIAVVPVPEPGTTGLLAVGVAASCRVVVNNPNLFRGHSAPLGLYGQEPSNRHEENLRAATPPKSAHLTAAQPRFAGCLARRSLSPMPERWLWQFPFVPRIAGA